jgi:hypothetical protein
MQKRLFFLIFLVFVALSCSKQDPVNKNLHDNSNQNIESVYRYYWGEKEGFKIWIVDGAKIRREIFDEFVYGGNNERYPFVPEKDLDR